MKLNFACAVLAVLIAQPAFAAVEDCPMRDMPYSANSPLYDVLISPAATAAVDAAMPGFSTNLPPFFSSKQIPSFATILTMKSALSLRGVPEPGLLEKIDAGLKTVAVTDADRTARCARYDNDVPKFAKAPKGKTRILLFEKMTGFRDGPSVEAAKAMVRDMATRKGWHLDVTEKGGAINAKTLKQFDVIIWNNVSGDVLTLAQRAALKRWMEKGGGFVAMHGSGGDPVYFWDWYADDLIGARFTGHPNDPQFQDAKLTIEKTPSGIGSSLAASFTLNDEWYSFAKSPRDSGANIIATLDESTYSRKGRFGSNLDMGADHPIVWTRCVGKGRSFYSAIGHRPEIYSAPEVITLIEEAVPWAAGKGQSLCKAGKEIPVSQR
jgi:uncharacterized protein